MASTNLDLGRGGGVNQQNAGPNPFLHSYHMNGKVIITAAIILVIIVLFILAFHVYARMLWWRRRHPLASWRRSFGSHDAPPLAGGLDRAVVDSLPTFTYTTPLLHEGTDVLCKEEAAVVVECAVCLIEFQQDDCCRLLPKCNHSFHTDCIDMWFLSNTTCPLCRTSAELAGFDVEHQAESSSALLLPHQDHGDHVERLNTSLLPHQDSVNRMQRSRSGNPPGGDLEGPGLHVRRLLMRTCSSRVGARYDLVGEEGMHNDTMSESMHAQRNGNMARDCADMNHSGEAFVRHLELPNWQRSVSDRSLNARQGAQFPSNVLFWGNHLRVDSRLQTNHWQVGGRSLPRITVDIPRPQVGGRSLPHTTIDVPKPQDSFLMPHSASNGALPCSSTGERPSSLSQRQPS